MFFGSNFIFDNINSERFGLQIGYFNKSGIMDTFSGIVRKVDEVRIKGNSTPEFFGVDISGKINFELLLFSRVSLDLYDRQAIDQWLFANEYKYFRIEQDDYKGFVFNCIFTEGTKVEIGSLPYAKRIKVECDGLYLYGNEQQHNYISTINNTVRYINNTSNINDYYYPEMVITSTTGGTVNITNNTLGETTTFTNLIAGEVLTVNNEKGIITSSLGVRRMSNFNKNWFRLITNNNTITLQGNFVITIKTRYKFTV